MCCLTLTAWILTAAGAAAQEGAQSGYWGWGWGTYGSRSVLDTARFDWSLINFGNVPADERTVQRCNDILAVNPNHRFVIRIWPIMGKGDCPENRRQATLFHYLYAKGVRERVLAETRRQVRLVLEGVRDPRSVAGMTFLEELPGHFTSSPFKQEWKPGDPLPWGIKRFETEIAAELGQPFHMGNPEHRLWWGKQYARVLEEIHRAMKEAGEGRTVIYWQATAFYTLDHYPRGAEQLRARIVPLHYRDIVKPGICDGIFGYPNNERVWNLQTRSVVERINCRFFSQLSTPAFMRIAKFARTVELARWEHPGNLGAFLYMEGGRSSKAWNELPYVTEDRYWTTAEHARRFAWDHGVGLQVVARALAPIPALDYDARGKRNGDFIHVWGQVRNPRGPSWYGGNAERARLKEVKLTLKVPDGFAIPPENSAPPTIDIADIPPGGTVAGDWWVRVSGDGAIPPGQAFSLTVTCKDGYGNSVSSTKLNSEIPALQTRSVVRSGDVWTEPAYRLGAFAPAAELVPEHVATVFPALASGGRSALYRGVLEPGTRLVIGPGHKATLFQNPILTQENQAFLKARNAEGVSVFSQGYPVYRSPEVKVEPDAEYRLKVTGKVADGAIFHAIVMFFSRKGAQIQQEEKSCLYNALGTEERSVEALVKAPQSPPGTASARVYFYCHNRTGALLLRKFSLAPAGIAAEGLDATARLDGLLPALERPFSTWTYRDRSDPSRHGDAKLTVRFFNPADIRPSTHVQRQGGDDF